MPRTTNPIRKLASGRWQVRYRDDKGKQRKRTLASASRAQEFLDDTRSSVRQGTYVDPKAGAERLSSFGTTWSDAQDWKATTRQSFPRAFGRAVETLRDPRLDDIDQLAIQRCRVELARQYAPKTVTLTMAYLNAVMKAAHLTGRIARDPTIGSSSKRRRVASDAVGPDDVPTRDEVLAILDAAPARYRAAIALGVNGLRIGEALGLSADRVDLEHRLVTIDRQLQRIGNETVLTTPKGEKSRTIGLPERVAAVLAEHPRDLRASDGLLFVTPRSGRPMRRDELYSSAWRPALAGAGLPADRFKFHALRHWCASSMLAEGVNPVAVAGHLGDTIETLHRVYSHWLRDDRGVSADALDRLLFVPSLCPSTVTEGA